METTTTSISEKYQKKTPREHVLLRPGTYMGNIYDVEDNVYIYDPASNRMVLQTVKYNTGVLKMFDEILMNSVDHSREHPTEVNTIRVDITPTCVIIYNNGPGIPIVKHPEHDIYIPELIFSHFLTSSNYDDSQKRLKAGMNGLGAKLTSTFSKSFIVETQYQNQYYYQVFRDNLSIIEPPIIQKRRKADYTKITFEPDCARFGTTMIDEGTRAILLKRAYDATAWTNGRVKMFYNQEKLPVHSFQQYVDLYLNEWQQKEKVVVVSTPRWKVAVCTSDSDQFTQISFVNGVQTHQGGTHVNVVLQQVLTRLANKIAKKIKSSATVRHKIIRDQLMIFVFAEIENPEFKSQAKEELTTRKECFGSTFAFDETSLKAMEKLQCVTNTIEYLKTQETKSLNTTDGKKKIKLLGVEKLDDANKAGTKESNKCTLILTEGDSAKTFATAGISLIGRDYYGIFPLKGKLLNVRNATMKKLVQNEEITNLKKILGLQHGKTYRDLESLKKSMRYGRICLLTDADVDAMHIEGLIINFFHYFWPQLLTDDSFIVSLPTPVVKVKLASGKTHAEFYDIPSFDEWTQQQQQLQANNNYSRYKIKYYKGLGTSTSQEAKEAFKDFEQKLLVYEKANDEDQQGILLAFHKDLAAQRQEWIQDATGKSLSLQIKGRIRISEFIHHGLVQFSIANCRRAIPSLMDGLKPSQRKVLYGCLKKRAWDEIKVDQLRGYVSEQTMYAHGDESLNKTIIGMNHNYVGSNNINVLIPCGSFGTRLLGGKDAASPRYISTKINPIVKHIFHSDDSQILTYLHESGYPVEPDYYVPVIPMILVNGANGIGTGFCTDIPTYNPLEICEILMKWLTNGVSNTSQAATLTPWAKNFLGTIEVHTQDSVLTSYTSTGKWHRKDDTTIVITELPLFTWTQDYKQFLDTLIEQAIIDDYLDFTTESVVKFEVSAPRLRIEEWLMEQTIVSIFNLQTRHKINLTCFDAHGQLRHYHTIHDMLRDYYTTRLEYYQKRHAYLDQVYTDEINNLSIKERFIQLVMNEDLVIFKQSKEIVDQQMLEFAFPRRNESYQYLLDTPLHHFTQTYADTLANKILEIQESQNQLRRKSAKDLWVQDLEMFKLNYTP